MTVFSILFFFIDQRIFFKLITQITVFMNDASQFLELYL